MARLVLLALGVLAKYTMLAFPASVGLYLVLDPPRRGQFARPGFWLLVLGCALGMVPIVAWNIGHDWVAAGQLSERLGFATPMNWFQLSTLGVFLAGEVAAWGLFWPIGLVALADGFWSGGSMERRPRPESLYLLALWGVVWLACIAAALLGENEVNWAAPGYLSILALTGTYLDRRLFPAEGSNALGSIRRRWIYGATWGLSMASLFIFMHLAWFSAVLVRLAPAATPSCPAPLRVIDPTTRMRGFTPLGPILKERLESLRAAGGDPFVLTPTYSLTASASFVLAGVENRPEEAYCLSWTPGMAAAVANQHDLWHPNPRVDAASFAGRPAIVVEDGNASTPSYARGLVDLGIFERAEPTERIVIRDRGTVVAAWDLTVCRGYRGPRNVDAMRRLFAVYSTRRYYNAHGGTRAGFIDGLYHDLLGRAASPDEERYWTGVLDRFGPTQVVARMAESAEYRHAHALR